MLTLPSGLNTAIQQRRASLSMGIKFTRQDSTVLAFTEWDEDKTIDSVLYRAASAGAFSAIQTKSDLGVDTLNLAGFGSSYITIADIRAGKWDKAAFEVIIFNAGNVSDGKVIKRAGWLGQSRISYNAWEFELQSLTRVLNNNIGETSSPTCRNDLGDARCGINLGSHTVTGTVTSSASNTSLVDTGRSEAEGHFTQGKLTFTSGANNGLSFEVKTYTASTKTFVLYLATPYTIAAGVTYSVSRGCQKRLINDCKTIFNNVVNFQGEHYLPGNDKLQRYGRLGV